MAKIRNTRSSKRLDLYNFETSEECKKLEFSFESEKKNVKSKENVPSKSKRKGGSTDIRNSSKTKRVKTDGLTKTKQAPAFEFFSTKTKKSRLSDSGIFMTPSPLQCSENVSLSINKSATPKSHLKSSNKPTQQTVSTFSGKGSLTLSNIEKQKQDSSKPSSITKTSGKTAKSNSSGKRSSDDNSRAKRSSPRLKNIESNSQHKKLTKTMSEKSTSTPTLPLRNRSVKNQKTSSLMSPPKVSPVHKVDSPTGHVMTSPDFCGSPSFKDSTQSPVVLQNSPVVNPRRTTRARAVKSTNVEVTSAKPIVKETQVEEYNSLMDESMFTPDSPVKSAPKSTTEQLNGEKRDQKTKPTHTEEYNSLMDESLFAPDSPIKSPRKPSRVKSRSKKQLGSSVTEEEKKKREDTNTCSELDDDSLKQNTSTRVNKYSAEQRSVSIKKHGRYSTSKVEAWAREVNSVFDDIESYELSID